MHDTGGFRLLPEKSYFVHSGVSLMAYDDIYPAGHQGGISVIMHDERIAANGDLRFEPTPGQWQPVPVQVSRETDESAQRITTRLHFPDEKNHLKGFNPMVYPDLELDYTVSAQADGDSVVITLDLETSLPESWLSALRFNLELFPGLLFGKSWVMDSETGIFPRQPSGPVVRHSSVYANGIYPHPETSVENTSRLLETDTEYSPLRADEINAQPYASGHLFTLCPEEPLLYMQVESLGEPLSLFDGRVTHNNGWFVLSSPLSRTGHAVHWRITPHPAKGWKKEPSIQISQVGYLPAQPKTAVIELSQEEETAERAVLLRLDADGAHPVLEALPMPWGTFLRYRYLTFDFSRIAEEGLYQIRYGTAVSSVFRIAGDVFSRGVWQPVLEYFLPVQMCHMLVREKYRVWHGLCHMDDARLAPPGWQHFDGYRQGRRLLTHRTSGTPVPGLSQGGWHDAGDFDLRIESQSGEAYLLSLAYETFHVEWDATTIDQNRQCVEIHQPDGKNDILQQIEHGTLAIAGGWKALGRLYRGIIASRLSQYVMLGDAAAMTDGISGNDDDRWVFTEDNPAREFTVSAHLACIYRSLRELNPELAGEALQISRILFETTRLTDEEPVRCARFHAAAELFLTTSAPEYAMILEQEQSLIPGHLKQLGWIAARTAPHLSSAFRQELHRQLLRWEEEESRLSLETPYGVPYRPYIWGAGWGIQQLGCEHYFLHAAFPDIFSSDLTFRALDFVLGCHPGRSESFASGIGASSVLTAYGFNRADSSYIPGGVVSGTALIKPDFPELKHWPYLWQQTEYVLGGGSSRFMFLVLAAQALASEKKIRD